MEDFKNKFLKFDYIPLEELAVGQSNVRTENTKDEDALNDLAEHIGKHGLLEPIVVFDVKSLTPEHPLYLSRKNIKERYEILAGQRRFTAFNEILNVKNPNSGWNKIPCHIREPPEDETDAIAISLGEGLTQLPFTLADSIEACDKLFKKFNDPKIVSRKTGISVKLIERYVKFNRLPKLLQDNLPMIHKNNKTAVLLAVEAADALKWSNDNDVDEKKVLELAQKLGEKKRKSNEDYKKMKRAAEENPSQAISEIEAISVKMEQPRAFQVVLEAPVYSRLESLSDEQGKEPGDQAADLIEEGLDRNKKMNELD